MARNQFGMNVKILHYDNGTEYINREFNSFLPTYGIIHQTTCMNTVDKNGGGGEKKYIFNQSCSSSHVYDEGMYGNSFREKRSKLLPI